MSDAKVPITREGLAVLQEELTWLWKTERPRVTQEVEAAAALGDRSENAEYIYGKKRLREIDRRLEFLSKRIDRLKVIDPAASAPSDGRVAFGAYVTVEDEDGKRSRYRIVGPDEIGRTDDTISIDSPMARALLGRRIGDDTLVKRPRGEIELTIVAVSYTAS